MFTRTGPGPRALAALLALSFIAPVFGCGRPEEKIEAAPPASQNAPYGYVPAPQQPRQQNQGMSAGKKLAILAGAAALIYLYNKHKNNQGSGQHGKYYLSRNGRVYYRDAGGNAIWVTPPKQGIQVPADEALIYQRAAQRNDWNVTPTDQRAYSAPALPGPRRGY